MEQIFVNYLMNRDVHTRYVKLCHISLGDHPGTGRSGVSTIPRLWTGLEHGLDSGLNHGLTDLWALINDFQQFHYTYVLLSYQLHLFLIQDVPHLNN